MHTFLRQNGVLREVPYMDYEVYLGPIPLYDWEGQSEFDVDLARSLLLWHNLYGV